MQQFVREEIQFKTDAEWHGLRNGVVTSTGMSALLGVSQYKTRLELWYEFVSGTQQEVKENERMVWGNRLEPVIAAGIAEDNKWTIEPMKTFWRIPELKAGSSFDFKITNNDQRPNQTGILEIKNVDSLIFKDKWLVEDGEVIEAPPYIEVQAMFQLFITGYDYITIGAFVGGNKPVTLTRVPDQQMFQLFTEKLKEFWHSVENKIEPEVDWERDAEFIRKLNQSVNPGTQIDATPEISEAVMQYLVVSKKIKELESKKEATKAFLLTHIGEAEKVVSQDFSISAGYVGPADVAYTREGYRNMRVFPKKHLKEQLENV